MNEQEEFKLILNENANILLSKQHIINNVK